MGLDMYLHKKHHIGNKWRKPEKMVTVNVPTNQEGVMFKTAYIDNAKISEIIEEVGYWRKANQIHAWFVANVEADNGGESYVSVEQLKELLATVKTVLKSIKLVKGKIKNGKRSTENGWEDIWEDGKFIENSAVCQRLLPTSSGFFFGSEEYDQWYVNDLKDTKKILEDCLKGAKVGDGSFYYSSSW
jgi:hypothetical protein